MRKKQDFIESLRIEERSFSREDMNYDTCILELVSKMTAELHIVYFRKKKTHEYDKEMIKMTGRHPWCQLELFLHEKLIREDAEERELWRDYIVWIAEFMTDIYQI